MLKALFSSNTRVKLLKTFLLNPEEEYFIRELTRKLNEQINSVRRELNNLKKIGLLKSRSRNRKKYFYINKDFLILEELKEIVAKCTDPRKDIAKKIAKLGKLELLVFSGSFIGKKNISTDLLLVGDINKVDLSSYLIAEVEGGKSIRYTILKKDDFLYRLKINDKFIVDILKDADNMVAVNKLKVALQ
ncbi:MAG TPA: ArsR family transcriptional regulator [Candidatus Peregrinibacteria bacterium]|nr:ArsR family transcriptional regulator [Candidatus Peregrinibacteria bacterium]